MVTLRPATIADLPLLERWGEDPTVLASGGSSEAARREDEGSSIRTRDGSHHEGTKGAATC